MLFLLNDQSEVLYIRQIQKDNASSFEFVGVVANEPAAHVSEENEPNQVIVIAAEPTLQLNQEIDVGPVNEEANEGTAERIQPVYILCIIHSFRSARKIILICTGQTVLCG